jgi:hypothetical protein
VAVSKSELLQYVAKFVQIKAKISAAQILAFILENMASVESYIIVIFSNKNA